MNIEVEENRKMIAEMNGIPIYNEEFTFYYDETGNCRKFSLNEKGYNSYQAIHQNFILAGVMYEGNELELDFESLYRQLGYSEEQEELKFKHLYMKNKSFIDFIGTKRASSYITWLSQSGLYIHYSTFNNLYYSLTDIVESLYELYPEIICNIEWCNRIKSALYDFTILYNDKITEILINNGYPNISNCENFCREFCLFIEENNDEDIRYPGIYMELLRQMLKEAGKRNHLVFLENNEPNTLIDEYYLLYLERCETFSHSKHFFDEELTVQRKLDSITLTENGKPFCNYIFLNSKNNRYIQISDLLCGLLGKLFAFLDEKTENDINLIRKSLTDQQIINFRNIYHLICKSDERCKFLLRSSNAMSNILDRMNKLEMIQK